MENEEKEIIYLPDENGNEVEFEVIATFEVAESGKNYVALVPVEPIEEDGEEGIYVFRYEEDGEDLLLYSIEDEAEWKLVEEAFNALVEASENV